jgi:glycosidase/predicted alpha/beta superfamily hydrolase
MNGRLHKTLALTVLVATGGAADTIAADPEEDIRMGKPVVYQVFTRLFGNKVETNKPWGTIEENGVGKFDDFTDAALEGIRELGVTHIWYTGVPHHAVIRDYTEFGIGLDDPDVVKGRAGSPYAVKDYYNVNPDLAVDPAKRLEEFEALIERTHAHRMKVIIDIVPNHVARGYESVSRPDGVEDFGANDDTSVEWARDNNFYYVVGEDFEVPESPVGYVPLGGDPHPLADGRFDESPAKWTGNGARAARPAFDDWFETVKVNYGVRPDGSYAFDTLPEEARGWSIAQHAEFWRGRDVPDSWTKFRDIVLYWTGKGVDGFRYDMAEMVPVEFWSYLNSSIKALNPDAFLLAEVYNPSLYRDYIQLGRMDYLYDKVGLYDTLKPVMQGKGSTDAIAPVHAEVLDIEAHMLHFLENHDEQRIASDAFAGDADKGRPAMVVSALLSRSPTMVYFGQDVGEPGDGDAGFGDPARTTIFDYWGVPSHQRWMNSGRFDGGALGEDEKDLRNFYRSVLSFSATNPAMQGAYAEIHSANREVLDAYDGRLFSFVRWQGDERLIVVSNFDGEQSYELLMTLPPDVVSQWQLEPGRYVLDEQLCGENNGHLVIDEGTGTFGIRLGPLESVVYRVGRRDIVRYDDFESDHVDTRNVDVWLPDGYDTSDDRYSVLYVHDGQNLFIPYQSVFSGVDWGVDESLQRLIDDGRVRKTIVVGIWSTPKRRLEYLPQEAWDAAPGHMQVYIEDNEGGVPESHEYLRFMVDELKPFIDHNYRTRPTREDTFVMGSSMGGLISLYGLIRHPETFAGAACVSTHWPLHVDLNDMEATRRFIAFLESAMPPPGKARIYFDYGSEELDGRYEPHQRLIDDMMRRLGYTEDEDWVTKKFEGAGHSEVAWSRRAEIPLEFLLRPGGARQIE